MWDNFLFEPISHYESSSVPNLSNLLGKICLMEMRKLTCLSVYASLLSLSLSLSLSHSSGSCAAAASIFMPVPHWLHDFCQVEPYWCKIQGYGGIAPDGSSRPFYTISIYSDDSDTLFSTYLIIMLICSISDSNSFEIYIILPLLFLLKNRMIIFCKNISFI